MNNRITRRLHLLVVLALVILTSACQPAPIPISGVAIQDDEPEYPLYLPSLHQSPSLPPAPAGTGPLLNVPLILDYEAGSPPYFSRTSIFWFGRVFGRENYADVRLGYTNTALTVYVTIIDRMVWYDTSPAAADFHNWDAVSLYIEPNGVQAAAPSTTAVRLDAQFAPDYVTNPAAYKASYRWNGTTWGSQSLSFSTASSYRGQGINNESTPTEGWTMEYTIPFSSLNLSGRPADKTRMLLAVTLHDRDTQAGSPQPDKLWPAGLQTNRTDTWGRISYGLPSFAPPNRPQTGEVSIRHGLNGAVVPDGAVGGGTRCGENLNFWSVWGESVYNNPDHTSVLYNGVVNIMNQRDVSDFPCFSKYYLTFPLSQIPAGKVLLSAELSLWQLGSAGAGDLNNPPRSSWIQVYTVNQEINPSTLTWNNAPPAQENVAQTSVDPLLVYPGWENLPQWKWDLARAADAAYRAGTPLRLVFYTSDAAQHSGKYFYPSESDCTSAVCPRPTLRITWGNP